PHRADEGPRGPGCVDRGFQDPIRSVTIRITGSDKLVGPGAQAAAALVAYVADNFDEHLDIALDPLSHTLNLDVIEGEATLRLSLSELRRQVAVVGLDYWHEIDPEWEN